MAKDMLKGDQDSSSRSMLILRPAYVDHTQSISGGPEKNYEQNQEKIEEASKIDQVVKLLVLLGGQATVFDSYKR